MQLIKELDCSNLIFQNPLNMLGIAKVSSSQSSFKKMIILIICPSTLFKWFMPHLEFGILIENLIHIVTFPSHPLDVWKQVKLNAYCSTFSSSVAIKLFLKIIGWENVRNPSAFCF
jgi:hypothetical protein